MKKNEDRTAEEIAELLNVSLTTIRKWRDMGMPWPWEPEEFLRWWAENRYQPEPIAELEKACDDAEELCLVLVRLTSGVCVLARDFEDENLTSTDVEESLTLRAHPKRRAELQERWEFFLEPFRIWGRNPNSPLAISSGLWAEIKAAWEVYGQEDGKICMLADLCRIHF